MWIAHKYRSWAPLCGPTHPAGPANSPMPGTRHPIQPLSRLVEAPLSRRPGEAPQQQIGIDTLAGESVVEACIAEGAGASFADQTEHMLGPVGEVRRQPVLEHLAQFVRQA